MLVSLCHTLFVFPALFTFWTRPAPVSAPWKNRRPLRFIPYLRMHRRTRAKPAWVRREVRRMKAFMPNESARKLADHFNRRFTIRGMTISKSTVADWLRADRYLVLQLRRDMKRRTPRPMPKNAVWGLDLTGKADMHGEAHMIFGCIDHGTRKCLALDVQENKNAWTLLGHLFLAMGRFGKPRAIRTDNEPCLTSRVFTTGLRLAGIRHQRTDPGSPWMNGRIERLFGTLKEKLNTIRPISAQALQGLLIEFRFWYDAVRPHQHLDGATPQEAWEGIDPWSTPVKEETFFEAWEGKLTGYYLRR
jgi:transposase InsO family protein